MILLLVGLDYLGRIVCIVNAKSSAKVGIREKLERSHALVTCTKDEDVIWLWVREFSGQIVVEVQANTVSTLFQRRGDDGLICINVDEWWVGMLTRVISAPMDATSNFLIIRNFKYLQGCCQNLVRLR